MTVQPQRPWDLVLIDREMELQPSAPGFLHPSAVLMPDGAAPKGAKRRRDAAGAPAGALPMGHGRSGNNSALFPLPGVVHLHEEQNQLRTVVSTGLRLSSASIPPILSEELAVHIKRDKDEIEQFINAQGEQLHRTLAQRQRRNYCSLISAAKDSIARRLREKEAELEQAARRSAELEGRLAHLRTESMAWQAKAMANQAKAATLHAQLQQAISAAATTPVQAAGETRRGGSTPSAEDAESAFVDPDRVDPERACRLCGRREAAAVLLPCRHLCLCELCDSGPTPVESCPVCRCVRTGSVRVFLA
ncbi:BOI-related E3 ubiquitin-protein ligase 1-like isoform X2 [Zingiber officinale]|uniref:BOI-related E3 ubiquitin-protein ligase 1-like isoform X2 n=1 Tax=Zingiber officinale TaxID=94328 RepID=UPI001C4AC09D|nr:BOI-related E3 ubiquitin-protein ligase 1-like isoform X2 [Zingiber officinale]